MDTKKMFVSFCMLAIIELACSILLPVEMPLFIGWMGVRLIYLVVMLYLAKEINSFVIAGIGAILSPVVGLITTLLVALEGGRLTLRDDFMAFIPFILVANIWKFYEGKGYAEMAVNLRVKTDAYWEKLWLVYMIGNLVLMLGFSDNIGNAEKIVKVVGFAILVIAGLIKSGLLIYTLFKLKKKGRGDHVNV